MKRDYTALLDAGVKAQLEKLEQNEHKTGFDEIDIGDAYEKLELEAEELYVELFDIDTVQPLEQRDHSKIRAEAADVANFAHMIILACDKEISLDIG